MGARDRPRGRTFRRDCICRELLDPRLRRTLFLDQRCLAIANPIADGGLEPGTAPAPHRVEEFNLLFCLERLATLEALYTDRAVLGDLQSRILRNGSERSLATPHQPTQVPASAFSREAYDLRSHRVTCS
jgi:hypothetical protein